MEKETKVQIKAIEQEIGEYVSYQIEVKVGEEVIPFKTTRSIYNYLTNIDAKIKTDYIDATIYSSDKTFVMNRQKIEYIEYRVSSNKWPISIKIAPEKSIGRDLAKAVIHSKATIKK